MLSIAYGVHTFSVGMVLTYKQFQKIKNACYKTGRVEDTSDIWKSKEQLYCYAYHGQGIKVYLHGKSGKLYRLRIQIEPCRVLGESDPTALFQPDKWTYRQLVQSVDKMLKDLKVPCSVDNMKISRCDLTGNIKFSSQDELMEYLRIFKKGFIIPRYECISFKKNEQKVKDWKTANAHSHCLSCKSANFLIYDKVAQLQMIDRLDESLVGKHILRLEAELKRPALKKHLGKQAMDTNYKLLSSAGKKSQNVIRWYLDRIQLPCDRYLRFEDAVKMVKESGFRKKTRRRMLSLLRKTSDKESLTAALEALRKEDNLSKNLCNAILKKFKKLGISPITLRNDSKFDKLPALNVEDQ